MMETAFAERATRDAATPRVLDSAGLAALDRVTEDAAAYCRVGRAAVTLADEGVLWLAGSFGFESDRMERAGSLCDLVITQQDALLVDDASTESRFRSHALVRRGGVRAYAGLPVGRDPALGTLAVFSPDVATFDGTTLETLGRLARLVGQFLVQRPPSGPLVQGWLGVRTLRSERNRPGLIVLSVSKGSPAERAGLRPTDILHEIDGQMLTCTADIASALAGRVAGETVPVRFRRGGAWHSCLAEVARQRRR